jgi:alpha-tubulin suppressor-like RCC1 family protein
MLFCWGNNTVGQLGDGTTSPRSVPTQIGSATTWSAITTEGQHSCGVLAGSLFCWGDGNSGQLGIGISAELTPAPVVVE